MVKLSTLVDHRGEIIRGTIDISLCFIVARRVSHFQGLQLVKDINKIGSLWYFHCCHYDIVKLLDHVCH
jgi:hypothetical protein